MKKTTTLLFTLTLLLLLSPLAHADPDDGPAGPIRSARLGITHIGLTGQTTAPERFENALALGAGWDRWPLYWNMVEPEPDVWDWSAYDELVEDNLRYGLGINAILLGRPAFHADGARIAGLHQPIFTDRTDMPGEGKTINADNPWAVFVWQAVNRYKPGGTLAQARGWDDDAGIAIWEVWNEPDYKPFWEASISDYARLLKVAYIVTKLADPEAQVMFGGLLYNTPDNWLARVLAIIQNDPFHEQHNWYMDIVAVHSYGYPWRSGWLTLYVRQTLIAYGIKRPIWLNESGVPVWDDYPGPVWAANRPDERLMRATAEQQAAFFIQSTAYAWAEGADVVFFHQLYDDCGNQPPGTDFRVHRGELCFAGRTCAGDAFGLYRNQRDSVCFSQHPEPGSARPAAAAFQLMARVFGSVPHSAAVIESFDKGVTVIVFDRAETDERIYVAWNRTFEPLQIDLPAGATDAALYTLAVERRLRPNADKIYRLGLLPAAPDNYPTLEPGDVSAIGGAPVIVVERLSDEPARDVLARVVVSAPG